MFYEGSQGSVEFLAAASAPVGTVTSYEDATLPTTATALFTGQTYTFIDLTVAQFANAGAAAQYAVVYVVFNSADPTNDLANAAVRMRLFVENGRGETKRRIFSKNTLLSCHYKCANTSADLVLAAECK